MEFKADSISNKTILSLQLSNVVKNSRIEAAFVCKTNEELFKISINRERNVESERSSTWIVCQLSYSIQKKNIKKKKKKKP